MDPITRLLALLERAQAKEVSGKRCFILTQKDFFQALGIMVDFNPPTDDTLRRRESLDNFEFTVTSADTERYYVCTEAKTVLDALWTSKKK